MNKKTMGSHDAAACAVAKSLNDLQEQLLEAKRLARILNELLVFRKLSRPLHVKVLCEKEKIFLNVLREKHHPAIPSIDELYLEMNTRSDIAIHQIPTDLEMLAQSEGLTLDYLRSRHPRYFFESGGLIVVEVNDTKFEAKVSTREGLLAKIPADANAIIELVKKEKQRLFGRTFEGSQFLADLRGAYAIAIKSKKGGDGDPVPLREVFDLMTRNISARNDYKADEFLVDLSELIKNGPGETHGYRFELQQTKDTNEGMLLLGDASGGMVNLLIFNQVNRPAS
jgi:hypothetical protein